MVAYTPHLGEQALIHSALVDCNHQPLSEANMIYSEDANIPHYDAPSSQEDA